ncbi:MAG TPA: MFS transporter [Acidimicrobiales bacterium]|nr:MFS transporter [Acidimicrobiales bacterium]
MTTGTGAGPYSDGYASSSIAAALDDAPRSRYHLRTVVVSGVGFFTDAYDLFVISTVATLVTAEWHLTTTQKSWVTGAAILGAFIGALVFGRIADRLGRKSVYVTVAVVMIVGALLSCCSPGFAWLVAARFILGLGIGGDYPVSAVLMSEYSNRSDRGRLVGLVFSMQALGLIIGPVVALSLISSGVSPGTTWRLLLGLGALPAAGVLWLRTLMPESPRFVAEVRGNATKAAADLMAYSDGVASTPGAKVGTRTSLCGPQGASKGSPGSSLWALLREPRMLRLLVGTAGGWLLFDYAYYGNTLSLPAILKEVSPHASVSMQLAQSLVLFLIFAVPGYVLAFSFMDRIGHRRLQLAGFAVMTAAFLALGLARPLTAHVAPFLAMFGVSYLFVEFGPNSTTFVLPSELFPIRARTTGHGISAGLGKLGAFVGVFLVPSLQAHIGLRGMLMVAAVASMAGMALTLLLPEPARRSLNEVAEGKVVQVRTRPIDVAPVADAVAPANQGVLAGRL